LKHNRWFSSAVAGCTNCVPAPGKHGYYFLLYHLLHEASPGQKASGLRISALRLPGKYALYGIYPEEPFSD
jgi:hypothetical protein